MPEEIEVTPLVFRMLGPTEQATQAVYVRNLWSDAWVLVPDLHCDSLTLAAAPSIGTASFSFRYGQRLQSPGTAWQNISRAVFNPRSYVRVVVTPTEGIIPPDPDDDDWEPQPIEWVGIWKTAVDSGLHQRFCADAIEAMLVSTVKDSFYYDVFGAVKKAGCALAFNAKGKPNRSSATHPVVGGQAYIFDADPERATYWTTLQAVEYLLAAHPPLKSDGSSIFQWYLTNTDVLPNYDRPTLETHGKDVLSLLHALISRFRLMSFRVNMVNIPASPPTPAMSVVNVRPFTFTDAEIQMSNLTGSEFFMIPANPEQFTLDFTRDPSSAGSLSIAANHVADRVTVVGGTRISVCTLSNNEHSLDKGWKPSRETEYVNAEAQLVFELPSEDERAAREEMIRQFRANRIYAEVFSRFVVWKYWNQKQKNGQNEGDENPIAIEDPVNEDDDPTQFFIPFNLLRLRDELPFLTGYEYDDEIIADAEELGTAGHRGKKVDKEPFLPVPMIVALEQIMVEGEDPKFIPLESIGQLADLEIQEIEGSGFDEIKSVAREWVGSARVLRDTAGLIVDVNNGFQHVLAHSEFLTKRDKVQGDFRWEQMIVTVAIDDPRQISVSYPPLVPPEPEEGEEPLPPFAPLGEFVNEKVIEVGPEYLLVYVVPQTVVAVSPLGELVRSTGGYLQDDRDYLKLVAQRAYEWHKTPRYAFTFSTGFIEGQLKVGSYIASIRDQNRLLTVGSVITEITIEFPKSKAMLAPPPKISYATAFAELDPTRII